MSNSHEDSNFQLYGPNNFSYVTLTLRSLEMVCHPIYLGPDPSPLLLPNPLQVWHRLEQA